MTLPVTRAAKPINGSFNTFFHAKIMPENDHLVFLRLSLPYRIYLF